MFSTRLKHTTLKELLSKINPEQTKRVHKMLFENHTYFCYTKDQIYYIWGIKNTAFKDINQKEFVEPIEVLFRHFHKKKRQLELHLEKYHQNIIFIASPESFYREKKNFGAMEYISYYKPILADLGYIYLSIAAKKANETRKLIQILDYFAQILAHECEHSITDLRSSIDRLEHEIYSEGIAELIAYFTQSNFITPINTYERYLNEIYNHETKKQVMNKDGYAIGFYLTLLLFVDFVNQTVKESPFRTFHKQSFDKQIHILEESKRLIRKTLGKEVVEKCILQFREKHYKKSLVQLIQEMKKIEKKLRCNSTIAKQFL